MGISGLTNAGALPSLELTMRFAAQKQRLVAHNIANFDTPGFHHKQLSTSLFQESLRESIRARRSETGSRGGALDLPSNREVRVGRRGQLIVDPQTSVGGVMTHDRNDRNLERTLQSLAETAAAFRTASALYTSQRSMLREAIGERV